MIKWKVWECKNCGKETLLWFLISGNWLCKTCFNSKEEEISKPQTTKAWIDKWDVCTINWLPIYTSSYLNNKMNINLNSIKKQTCCVEYKWRYILHCDIIKQFTDLLPED